MFLKRLQSLCFLLENCQVIEEKKFIKITEGMKSVILKLKKAKEEKRKVFIVGNGGSCGIATHFKTDLLNKLKISAFTLTESNLMTCISNDYGYQHVFSSPLKIHMEEKDILFAISSSGNSENIINASLVALEKKGFLITLSGFLEKNSLKKMGNINFWINRSDYGLVEMAHFFILHTIVDLWNVYPFLTKEKLKCLVK